MWAWFNAPTTVAFCHIICESYNNFVNYLLRWYYSKKHTWCDIYIFSILSQGQWNKWQRETLEGGLQCWLLHQCFECLLTLVENLFYNLSCWRVCGSWLKGSNKCVSWSLNGSDPHIPCYIASLIEVAGKILYNSCRYYSRTT